MTIQTGDIKLLNLVASLYTAVYPVLGSKQADVDARVFRQAAHDNVGTVVRVIGVGLHRWKRLAQRDTPVGAVKL
jgi:hypothetical protein